MNLSSLLPNYVYKYWGVHYSSRFTLARQSFAHRWLVSEHELLATHNRNCCASVLFLLIVYLG